MARLSKRPNFFIIGAPKCGTTALAHYLSEHPQIYFSQPKEPHYFATDFPNYRDVTTEAEYLELFQNAEDHHLAIGEGSVFYLYSKEAVPNLLEFCPEARIIVMLRNPVELVHSFHAQALYACDEEVEDFEAAWKMQAERTEGRQIPKSCRHVEMLHYAKLGSLAEQLKLVQEKVAPEQLKIILFDDFLANPRNIYLEVLSFLDVPDDGRKEFPRVNPNNYYINRSFRRFLARPPRLLKWVVSRVKRTLGVSHLGIAQSLSELNSRVKPRQGLSAELRAELVSTFSADIEQLGGLVDRDLSAWLRPE